MLERKKRRQLLTVECVRFIICLLSKKKTPLSKLLFAFVSLASVAITDEYTLRYPSQNEGRGCGGGGIQIRRMNRKPGILCATNWSNRELNS